jgi:hypothetical protein
MTAMPTSDQLSTAVALIQAARAGDDAAAEDVAAAAVAHALGVDTPAADETGDVAEDDYPTLAAMLAVLVGLARVGAQLAAGGAEPVLAVREVADLIVAVGQVDALLARGRDLGEIGMALASSEDTAS